MKNLVIFFLSCAMISCHKDPIKNINTSGKVIILNEGTFNFSNASISTYQSSTNEVFRNAYNDANGKSLGDVAQSAIILNDKLIVAVNNSQRIEILDKNSLKQTATIPLPLSSPRYLCPINDSLLLISELYANKLWVVNILSKQLVKSIAVNGWTEQMMSTGTSIIVLQKTTPFTSVKQNSFLVFDKITQSISKIIPLDSEPNSLEKDNAENIYILSSGDTSAAIPAKLLQVNTNDFTFVEKIIFPVTASPKMLRYNKKTNEFLYVAKDIYKIIAPFTQLETTNFIATNNAIIYGLNCMPNSAEIFYSDAIDFVQSSKIFRYNSSGNLITTFNAGVLSNQFISNE